jgi:hypothetical protein
VGRCTGTPGQWAYGLKVFRRLTALPLSGYLHGATFLSRLLADGLLRLEVLNQIHKVVDDVRQGPGQLAGGPSPFLALFLTRQGLIQRLDEVITFAGLLLYPAITPDARRCPRAGYHSQIIAPCGSPGQPAAWPGW